MKRTLILLCFFTSSCFSQIITTFAGNGISTYSGDGGLATNASFSEPETVAVDDSGNVYIADEDNNRIRKVNTLGIITTFAGTGGIGYSGNGGPATAALLDQPAGVGVDTAGNVYIADTHNNVIRKVNKLGIISTFAGNTLSGFSGDGGNATSATLNLPEFVVVDKAGNVFIADAGNHRIRVVNTSGIISTYAGTGAPSFGGDGSAATLAQLNYPTGIALGKAGKVYIADYNNNRIRVVDALGIITTFAGTGVAGFGGNGGQAALAMLNTPQQVTADTAGNIFVTDAGNSVIRKITPSGIISSFAGNRTPGYSGDGGPAFLAEVFHAPGVSSDKHNNIYISDYSNSRVRKVSYCATPLTLSISGTFSVCTGDSTQLTASGATTYTWSSGATANTVYVKPIITSSYSVAGVTGQCAAVDSVTVNVVSCSSNITGFERDKMIIYPNPASDLVSIHSSLNTSMLVEIYNSTGEKLLSNPVKNSETRVNLNNLNAGMYFMRIIFGDGTIHQATIIKQ